MIGLYLYGYESTYGSEEDAGSSRYRTLTTDGMPMNKPQNGASLVSPWSEMDHGGVPLTAPKVNRNIVDSLDCCFPAIQWLLFLWSRGVGLMIITQAGRMERLGFQIRL